MTAAIRDSLAQVLADIRRAAKAHEIKKDRPGASIDVTEWHAGWDEGATYAADSLETWMDEHGPELIKMLDRHGAGDAEDLEQFREAAECMKREGIREQSGGFTRGDPQKIAKADRLLSIIDARKATRAGERG